MIDWQIELPDAWATEALGKQLASVCHAPLHIYFQGEIGAGKTTLIRALLQALGITESIRSPTYTLVEHYQTPNYLIYHFDLYRLNDPEELEYLGWRDFFAAPALCLVEWPQQGTGLLPVADINCLLEFNHRAGRVVQFTSTLDKGVGVIQQLQQAR
ncbi:MAG: tRNA (adenosine(37)-N6)-threonylcarbamoyltransferase complex ATPase subunit type 1 TsaE [Legionellales bacterium]|nr:tRNA (adenosine(37)-N6)-threonylcarbamoyltransferase complex ATPase subunit type 1 TsaE [Legionellales bacterium]